MLSEELAWADAGCAPPSAPHLPQVRHRLPAPGLSGPVWACLLRVQPPGRLSCPGQPSPAALPSPFKGQQLSGASGPRGFLRRPWSSSHTFFLWGLCFCLHSPGAHPKRQHPGAPRFRVSRGLRVQGLTPGSQLQAAPSGPPHLLASSPLGLCRWGRAALSSSGPATPRAPGRCLPSRAAGGGRLTEFALRSRTAGSKAGSPDAGCSAGLGEVGAGRGRQHSGWPRTPRPDSPQRGWRSPKRGRGSSTRDLSAPSVRLAPSFQPFFAFAGPQCRAPRVFFAAGSSSADGRRGQAGAGRAPTRRGRHAAAGVLGCDPGRPDPALSSRPPTQGSFLPPPRAPAPGPPVLISPSPAPRPPRAGARGSGWLALKATPSLKLPLPPARLLGLLVCPSIHGHLNRWQCCWL